MIILDDKYVIDVDDSCYTLKVRGMRKSKDGTTEAVYRPLGYFSSLFGAVKGWYGESVRDAVRGQSMTITDALNRVSECSMRVTEVLRKAIPEPEEK